MALSFAAILRFLRRRSTLTAATVIFKLLLLAAALVWGTLAFPLLGSLLRGLAVVAALRLISGEGHPAYKLSWVSLMLIWPQAGLAAYLLAGDIRLPRRLRSLPGAFPEEEPPLPCPDSEALRELERLHPAFSPIGSYLHRCTGFPVWQNTSCRFFCSGSELFGELCQRLREAQRFIFMEYFIISPGALWDEIEAILIERGKSGVEIRLLYDDMGCIDSLGSGWRRRLEEAGAEISVFNRCRAGLYPGMNYRDHRKICVIDGETGFCGGANIADEYINRLPRCGHWKDTGVMLGGEGVFSLTLMFLTLWDFSTGQKSSPESFAPRRGCLSDGLIQPFGDSPLDKLCAAEDVWIMSLYRARRYLYITTPYLIPDNEMIRALCSAALSGTDVRIITPGVPDKWYVHSVSRSFYGELLRRGVRIFEYTPGFIHSKQLVCDDELAVVGTANLDFRSFYLHFEAAVCIYGGSAVEAVRLDIERLLAESREITLKEAGQFPFIQRLAAAVIRPFSPLF